MDYKEKYQNALERAKKGLPIDEVFPELKESEDEGIRRFIIDCISELQKANTENAKFNARCGEAISYLEKQKEQKPSGWSEEDEEMLYSIIEVLEVMPSARFIPIKREIMIPWLKSLPERFNLQSKQEWNKEDEQFLLVCKNALQKYQSSYKWDAAIIYNWLEKRLKSLRPQPHWKKSFKTADLENSLCDLQDNYHDGSHEYKVLGEAIEFIRCTESRSSWKPSEEQMEALARATNRCVGVDDAKILIKLLEQLEKL